VSFFQTANHFLKRYSLKLGSGLNHLLSKNSKKFVGICARNSLEWLLTDFACVSQGLTSVAIPVISDKKIWERIVEDCDIECVVCDPKFTEIFLEISSRKKTLKYVIEMTRPKVLPDPTVCSEFSSQKSMFFEKKYCVKIFC
jgi:long-subunit acyl-CoA synthetase (AMP-forming)